MEVRRELERTYRLHGADSRAGVAVLRELLQLQSIKDGIQTVHASIIAGRRDSDGGIASYYAEMRRSNRTVYKAKYLESTNYTIGGVAFRSASQILFHDRQDLEYRIIGDLGYRQQPCLMIRQVRQYFRGKIDDCHLVASVDEVCGHRLTSDGSTKEPEISSVFVELELELDLDRSRYGDAEADGSLANGIAAFDRRMRAVAQPARRGKILGLLDGGGIDAGEPGAEGAVAQSCEERRRTARETQGSSAEGHMCE